MTKQTASTSSKLTSPASSPVAGGILHRKCACGRSPGAAGECEECRKRSEVDSAGSGSLQRAAVNREPVGEVPPIVYDALRSPGQPLDPKTRAFMEPRFGHDFSCVRVQAAFETYEFGELTPTPKLLAGEREEEKKGSPSEKASKKPSTKGAARQQECGKKCGGTELGSVECELDLKTGMPTDKVSKVILEKDPCIKHCVDSHETVHVKDVEPVCKKGAKCLSEAKSHTKKRDKCLDTYEADLWGKVAGSAGTECSAYKAEEECLKKRESAADCKSNEGRSRWSNHLTRTKCYEGCYCKK